MWIAEVPDNYAAGFDEAMHEQFDKTAAIEKILEKYPQVRSFILKGDSSEDEEALDSLKFKQQKGRLDQVNSIYVTDSPNKLNDKFDVNIPRNYDGLVSIMKQN